ncbi:MAG: Do family serine endopeptidase [Muribaculaceae bacterium]|nr:Do family serine endopeptidase [Muribaculaceae bacterium]
MNKTKTIVTALAIILTASQASAFENVDFTRAAEATVNSVVSIKSYNKQRTYGGGMNVDPFFEFFFGHRGRVPQQQQPQNQEPQYQQSGLGSGVILSSDGIIVTNNHVIDGAEKLEVTLNDNRTFEATVVGYDQPTDLAVLRINATNLPAIEVGESDDLKVGEWVLAVGNPFGFTSTVTAGIVSAKARNISSVTGAREHGIESYIQTDAAVNPGNSGGALVNLSGQLVGINAAIYSQTGNYAGYSFAIPTSIMRNVVEDLTNYGNVQRAVLGLRYRPLTPQLAKEHNITAATEGLLVAEIIPNTAASEAGIRENDLIVSIDGQSTVNSGQLQEAMAKHRPGDRVTLGLYRDNAYMTLPATLRNNSGTTKVTRAGDFNELGCVFSTVSEERCRQLNIPSGLEVTKVSDGKFKDAGIREGFIIVDINNAYVTKPEDVRQLYNSIVESTQYDHVMFISGIYPGANRKSFYAVDLTN